MKNSLIASLVIYILVTGILNRIDKVEIKNELKAINAALLDIRIKQTDVHTSVIVNTHYLSSTKHNSVYGIGE